jgi:iron complex outermembrane receptor protein
MKPDIDSRLRTRARRIAMVAAWLCLSLAVPGAPSPAAAQSTERRSPHASAIETITVTARKREEDLQKAPLSVSAFDAEALREASVVRIDDLSQLVPGLRIDGDDTAVAARLFVRGVGTYDTIPTRDPGVGLYLDGVYLPRAQGALLDLAEVERVEVLRGPQGTLYGRNTIGGAVNVISRRPTSERSALLSANAGSYGLLETKAALSLPLIEERLFSRISIVTRTRDGYSKNVALDHRTDDDRLLGGRIALRALPSDGVELGFVADATRQHRSGRGGQCRFGANAPAATGFVEDPLGVGAPQAILTLVPFVDMVTGFVQRCRTSREEGDLEYRSNVKAEVDMDTRGAAATARWELGPGVALTSITSWRRIEAARDQEYDYTATALGRLDGAGDRFDAWSQELTLGGPAFEERLQWTAGLYAFWEEVDPGRELTLVGTDLGTLAYSYAAVNATKTRNLAAFGQATWYATDRLSLTGGVRRLLEQKRWSHRRHGLTGSVVDPQVGSVQSNPGPDGIAGTADDVALSVSTSERFDAWTGLANVAYELDELLLYAQWASGYKSGGFNARTNPADLATIAPFEPEQLDSFEVGLKSAWLDRRVTLHAALFHSLYRDIQQTLFASAPDGSFSSIVRNASKATVRGAELELRAHPWQGLYLGAAFGVTDAKYEENRRASRYVGPGPNGIFGDADDAPRVLDRKDEDFQGIPAYTLTVSAAYEMSTPFGTLVPSLSWYAQSRVNHAPAEDLQGSHFGIQGKYGLLDGRLSLRLDDGVTQIALWGRNLLDRRYENGALDFTDGFAVTDVYFGAPRMIGIEIRRAIDF